MKTSKIWTIIRSRLKSKKNMPDWYYERLEVCRTCEWNSKNRESTLKGKILYLLNSLEPYCSICSCNLKAKASIADPDESDCGMVNLGEESKWKHIKTT